MKPSESELKAIKISEDYYNKERKSFLKKLLLKKFSFENYETPDLKNLFSLWQKFGLKNSANKLFSKEEKLECIDKWHKILYNNNFDIVADYHLKDKEFGAQARKVIKENPGVHFNWILPSPENYLNENQSEIGNYN